MKPRRIVLLLVLGGIFHALPVFAQNTTFATSVHIVAGQPAVRVTLATGTPDRFYAADVVAGRSYCAEATASDTETNSADPALTIFRGNHIEMDIGGDTGSAEPKGQVAARRCFIAPATETIFIKLSPESAAFENREYTMRFVETTLWANWFFVGGGYSSFTILRNTTNSSVTIRVVLRGDTGAQAAAATVEDIPPNGTFHRDARQMMGCLLPSACNTVAGSVEIAHNGSPEAIVGSQTTLSAQTGLSFDTIMFQRRPW